MIELNLHKLTTDIELNKMKFDFENTIEINHKNLNQVVDTELRSYIQIVLNNSPLNYIHGINPSYIQYGISDKISLWISNLLSDGKIHKRPDFKTIIDSLISKGILIEYSITKKPFNLEQIEIIYVKLTTKGIQLLNEANCIKTKLII